MGREKARQSNELPESWRSRPRCARPLHANACRRLRTACNDRHPNNSSRSVWATGNDDEVPEVPTWEGADGGPSRHGLPKQVLTTEPLASQESRGGRTCWERWAASKRGPAGRLLNQPPGSPRAGRPPLARSASASASRPPAGGSGRSHHGHTCSPSGDSRQLTSPKCPLSPACVLGTNTAFP